MIEAAGATLLHLLPYSPGLNPIEQAFSKLTARLRKVAETTVPGLLRRIGRLLATFSPTRMQKLRVSFAGVYLLVSQEDGVPFLVDHVDPTCTPLGGLTPKGRNEHERNFSRSSTFRDGTALGQRPCLS
jgi:hypothetical protein